MDSDFDPYYKWLGIPPGEQPPNHYRLLGLRDREVDSDVISHAADRQMAHVRTFQAGRHSAHSQRLLNEIAAARVVLLNAEQKQAYDARLKSSSSAAGHGEPPATFPGIRTRRRAARANRPIILQPGVWLMLAVVWLVALVGILVVKYGPAWTGPAERRASDGAADRTAAAAIDRDRPVVGTSQPRPDASSSVPARSGSRASGSDVEKKQPGGSTAGKTQTASPTAKQPTYLGFTFTDQTHCKKYWEWNDPWEFQSDGAHVPRGPASFLRSRYTFSGDIRIELDFSYGQAKFSNTGGAWITIWGQRLPLNDRWRSLNASVTVKREGNELVYTLNGKAQRFPIDASLAELPTDVEIRWRSRTAHFRRAEITAQQVEPKP